ncbi:hypothetical protein [Prescottella subtropica]|uniref:hypothetical protein n=1 Tax=Prescottella subtropica TaxID=2545757 RepID=UPI0010F6356C|nr:hypothetical protein [Prescottella subtropica]
MTDSSEQSTPTEADIPPATEVSRQRPPAGLLRTPTSVARRLVSGVRESPRFYSAVATCFAVGTGLGVLLGFGLAVLMVGFAGGQAMFVLMVGGGYLGGVAGAVAGCEVGIVRRNRNAAAIAQVG